MTSHGGPTRYLRLSLTARPPRVGVVLPETGDGLLWLTRLFTGLSRIWGGGSFVALPPSLTTRRIWKQLLRAYDPDRVAPLGRTFRGEFLGHDDQTARESELRRRAEHHARQQNLGVSLVLEALERDQDRPYGELLDDDVVRWLEDVCAPLDEIRQPWLTLGNAPGYEFNDLLNWDQSDLPPAELLQLPIRSRFLDLLVASRVGNLDAELWDAELARGAPPLIHRVAREDLSLLLKFCWLGTLDERDLRLRHAFQAASGLNETAPTWFSEKFALATPLRRSNLGCTWLYPSFGGNWEERPLVVVVGDTTEDFCLFHLARHLFAGAVWIPRSWATGTSSIADSARRSVTDAIGDAVVKDREILFTSVSRSRLAMGRHASRLLGPWKGHTKLWRVAAPEDIPEVDPVAFVATDEMWNVVRWAPFLGETQGDRIDTPIPEVIRRRAGESASWHVDVSIDDHRYPVRSALRQAMVVSQSAMDAHNVRPSSAGVSYWTEGALRLSGQALRHHIIRPRLRTPPPIEVFDLLLAEHDYSCRYSDKGQYAANSIRLWGGLDELADDLSLDSRLRVLRAFLSKKASGVDPGVRLHERRYLTFWDLRRAAGLDRESLRRWLDDLLDKGVLTRGLVVQCGNCRYSGWYPATLVGRTFDCRRCRNTQMLRAANWKNPSEPMWYYELAEVVFQALRSDCREVVLTLSRIKKESRRGFHYEPQMELVKAGEVVCEVDIWAISNGRIILGEAKSGNRLASSRQEERSAAEKLLEAAQACGADRALFASTAKIGWRTQTRQVVDDAFAMSGIRVDWLSNLGS